MSRTLKLWALFLVAILAIWGGSAAFKSGHASTKECEALFTSGLYKEYHRQLANFIKESSHYSSIKLIEASREEGMQQLLALVDMPLAADPNRQREQHESFVLQLRKVASDSSIVDSIPMSPSRKLFEEIIKWIFLQADLSIPAEAFSQQFLPLRIQNQSIFDYLISTQQELHRSLKQNLQNRKKQWHDVPEDHYFSGNLPLGMAINVGETTVIRLAQPLIGNAHLPYWMASPKPSPEFLQFVRQQRHHLYVNLMRRQLVEGSLTASLENLEIQEPHLSVVTLDKNSDFYWQKGCFSQKNIDSDSFKRQFMEKMSNTEGDFYWSGRLTSLVWHKQLQQILEYVHRNYFFEMSTLNRFERLDFIELTYLSILNELIQTLHPSSMNITCRQSMDRGPSMLALWLLEQNIRKEEHLTMLLFLPPYIIHHRTCHESRLERLISASKRINCINCAKLNSNGLGK